MHSPREIHTTLLIADLSGYTSLAEAHGDLAVADIVDRFTEIIQGSLAGDVRIVDQIGDEVLLSGASPEAILRTAVRMSIAIDSEPDFPAIHVGIHCGSVVEKNGRLFGRTVNITARIASFSRGGQILCSGDVAAGVEGRDEFRLVGLGDQRFKNVTRPVNVFEVIWRDQDAYPAVDPVCRMQVNRHDPPAKIPYRGKEYFFCSFDCARTFIEHPDDFLASEPG